MGTRIAVNKIAALKAAALPFVMVFAGCVPAALSVNDHAFQTASGAPASVDSLADRPEARAKPVTNLQVPAPRNRVEATPAAAKETSRVFKTQSPSLVKGESNVTTARKTRSTGKVEHTNTGRFQQDVLEADLPVLVDFYADWCGPCRALAPALDELARNTPHAKVVKVDIDKNPQLAAKYRVNSIPTVMVFKDGSIVAQHTGLANQKTLEQLLDK
jgi:thioredoxin 1